MKKSGSTKRTEFENHRSPNLPNYMKSTSSSEGRKEQSQVSTRSPQTSHVSSDLHGTNNYPLKPTAESRNTAAKTLARTTSWKMKRTLIKPPGFKPGRALMRKCPKVVLCEDLDIARATCSSSLKDYKLPDYLVLNPGGTESEGTSVIKVCPYTCCSLNGHHHDPLPPLKSFISARRCMLKNQRNVQLAGTYYRELYPSQCLPPWQARPVGDDTKYDDKLANKGDLGSSTVCPLTLEEPNEFFIETYRAGEENTSNTDFMLMLHVRDEIVAQDYEQVEEAISDGSIGDDINFHEHLDEDRDETDSKDMYANTYPEVKIPEEISSNPLFQEETKLGNLSTRKDIATESMPSVQLYEQDSESSDLDRETGGYSASEEEKGIDLDGQKDENGIESDNCINSLFDELQANDESSQTLSEDGLHSDAFSSKDDCKSEVSFHYLDDNSMKISALIEFPKDEPEAIYEDKYGLPFEGNRTPEKTSQVSGTGASSDLMIEELLFGLLNFEGLPNEDATAGMGEEEADLLKDLVQEIVTFGGKAMSDTMTDVDVSAYNSSDEGLRIPVEENFESLRPVDSADGHHSKESQMNAIEAEAIIVHQMREDNSENATKPAQAAASNEVGRGISKNNILLQDQCSSERITIAIAKCKRSIEESDDERQFNPRDPNFLQLEPEPEPEKVDLRHQEVDEKKNAEEWMVDYALRQTVTKLGPARKKKVALLVEAFEKVMPITKCELNQSHSSAFDHARSIQACN